MKKKKEEKEKKKKNFSLLFTFHFGKSGKKLEEAKTQLNLNILKEIFV